MRTSTLLLVAAVAVCGFITTSTQAAILVVDCVSGPFFTVQSAVDVAVDGDTIDVHACTYNEAVSISGLNRVSLIAADSSLTGSYPVGVGALPAPPVIIDSSTTGAPCIRITGGSSVTISGFRLNNCDTYGIIADTGRNNAYHGNRIQNAGSAGIMESGSFSVITGNAIALSGSAGIGLDFANFTYVADNRIALNGASGLRVFGDFNHFVNNDVVSNTMDGLTLEGKENRVERNRLTGNGGTANLLLGPLSGDADVVGNNTAGSIVDLGSGTELMDNI